jgi:hypothetical protein
MLSILYAGTSLLALLFSLLQNKRLFAQLLVLVCLLTNIVSVGLYIVDHESSNVNWTVATREISVYLLLVVSVFLFFNRFKSNLTVIDKTHLIALGVASFSILNSIRTLGLAALLSGRELIFPLAVYFIFRLLVLSERAIPKIIITVVSIAVIAALIGIAETTYTNFANPSIWESEVVNGYLSEKYGQFQGLFPLSWMNYMPVYFGFEPGLRLVGLMTDPLVTGHVLACAFALVIYWYRGAVKWILAMLIGIGVMCTFSKAALLICFVTFALQCFKLRSSRLRNAMLVITFMGISGLGFVLLSTGDDNATHFGSFKIGLESLISKPLGNGVGSTGYFTLLTTGEGTMAAIDTTFSVYVYQMGIPGLFALLIVAVYPFYWLLRQTSQIRGRKKGALLFCCTALFCAYSILAFSSSAAFNAVPIFIPQMLLGMLVASKQKDQREAAISIRTLVWRER